MILKRILFFFFLLGIWGQAASACPEAHVASAAAWAAMEITVSASEDFVATGGEHRCECPATVQNAKALVSESDRFLLASYVAGAGALLNLSNPRSIALAERNRESSYISRPFGRPPYLLLSHLRQ